MALLIQQRNYLKSPFAITAMLTSFVDYVTELVLSDQLWAVKSLTFKPCMNKWTYDFLVLSPFI